jgi:hypothetical protein
MKKFIRFTSEGIFGLLVNRANEDEILRLIKSNYPPAPEKTFHLSTTRTSRKQNGKKDFLC